MVNVINDLNQETDAGMLGMSAVAYGRIERNETDISLKRINQIAKALKNAVNESFLQTIVNLNENVVRLNDIILQINKK